MEEILSKIESCTYDELVKIQKSTKDRIEKHENEFKASQLKQDKIGKIFKDDCCNNYYLIRGIEKDKYCVIVIYLDDDIMIDGEYVYNFETINNYKEVSFEYVHDKMYLQFKELENKFMRLHENVNKFKDAKND